MAKVTKELIAKALKLYHGTNVAEDFKEFVPAKGIMGTGVYATPDTHAASTYAAGDVVGKQRGTASRVIPVDANLQNVFDFDNATKADEIRILEANGINADEVRAIPDDEYKFDRTYLFDDVLQGADPAEVLGKAGYDGATAKEAFDRGGVRTGETYQSYVTYDPKNLSSSLSGAEKPSLDDALAARLQRAREQGYDTDTVYYHGTDSPEDFTGFRKNDGAATVDGWFTDKPDLANDHAKTGKGNDRVIPAFLKTERTARFMDIVDAAKAQGISRYGPNPSGSMFPPTGDEFSDFVQKNYDAVDHSSGGYKIVVPTRPENIRSVNAMFDPAKRGTPDIMGSARPDVLAGVAGSSAAALGLAKALQNRQERDKHGTIEAPKNPTALKLADAIRDLDRRTKGSPANLLVPTSTAQFLSNVGYNQKTPVLDKVLAAAEWLP